MGEGPSVRVWVDVNNNKTGERVTKAEFAEGKWPGGTPDVVGSTLLRLEAVGKLILATFERTDATKITLVLCRGSGGGKEQGLPPLMRLSFGRKSITIYPPGTAERGRKTNVGASAAVIDADAARKVERMRALDVCGDAFDARAVVDAINELDERDTQKNMYLATALLNQDVICGVGNGQSSITVIHVRGDCAQVRACARARTHRRHLHRCCRRRHCTSCTRACTRTRPHAPSSTSPPLSP